MEKECLVCKSLFNVKPSHFDKRFCCGQECRTKHQKATMNGVLNPNFRNAAEKFCLRCGNKYYSYNKKSKYCSQLCGNTANRLDERGPQKLLRKLQPKPKKDKKKKQCFICGELKTIKKGRRRD